MHLSDSFWLFAPKFWEVVGTYEMMVLLTNECRLSGGGTQTLHAVIEKRTFCIHRGWGYKKRLPLAPARAALPLAHPSHLVKLSLPNCKVPFTLSFLAIAMQKWVENDRFSLRNG